MATMIAALYDGHGGMRIGDIEKPEAGPGEAIIKVRYSGICGSDLLMNAEKTEPDVTPFGHEVAGEIVEVGDGVDRSRIGERVAIEAVGHSRACGKCWFCRMGQYIQCMDIAPRTGGFAQYMKGRINGFYALPGNLSWEEGALVEPLAVSVHAVRRAPLRGGETVLVLGAGTIGLTSVAAARAYGAGKVFVTARHEQQAAMAKSLGADEAFSPDGPELAEALAEATGGRGADVTIETVGGNSGATLEQSIEHTRKQGRIVILGGFRAPITMNWIAPLLKEQSIIFSSCYSIIDGKHDYELAADLMSSGRAPIEQIVTHRFPLEEAGKAFETAYSKSTGSIKVQLML